MEERSRESASVGPMGRTRSQAGGRWPRRARALAAVAALLLAATMLPEPARGDADLPDLSQPLSLEALLRIAGERNLGLAQSRESVAIASGGHQATRSGLLPSLSGDLGYNQSITRFSAGTRSFQGISIPIPPGRTVDDRYSLGASARQNLWDGSTWYSTRQSMHRMKAARLGFADARRQLVLAVKQQYYSLFQAKELAKVAREAYQLNEDQLKRAESLFQLGSVAKSDVLQAQVNLAASERDRIAAENSIEQERARLNLVLALPIDSDLRVQDPEPPPDAVQVEPEPVLGQRAAATRPDLKAAEESYLASKSAETSARWARYPSLAASASYSKQLKGPVSSTASVSPTDLFRKLDKDATWGVSLGLSVPIFDGLRTKGSIQQATAERRSNERAVQEKQLQVSLDVREALLAIKTASEGIRSARQGVALADESVRLQKALYESGGGTLLEWSNAQVQLTRARVAVVQAEVNLRLAQANLESALGEDVR